MKNFGLFLNEQLTWKHDGTFKRSWTLQSGNLELATLKMDHGAFRSDMSIYFPENPTAQYVFRNRGFMKVRVEYDTQDVQLDGAKVKARSWGGGVTIDFVNGNRYEWKKSGSMGREWALTDANGFELAVIKNNNWNFSGILTIRSDEAPPSELTFVVFVGIYRKIVEMQQAAAAGAAAASAA